MSGQRDVAQAAKDNWENLFNVADWSQDEVAMRKLIAPLERDASCQLSAEQAATLLPEHMFAPARMSEAMDAIRKGTMPGESGVSVDLVAHKAWREKMAKHLSDLAIAC